MTIHLTTTMDMKMSLTTVAIMVVVMTTVAKTSIAMMNMIALMNTFIATILIM